MKCHCFWQCWVVAIAMGLPTLAFSQPPRVQQEDLDALHERIDQLHQSTQLEIARLQEALKDVRSKPSLWDRFDPRLTVYANMLNRLDDDRVFNEDGDRIDDRFLLRETELDLRARLDPFGDAVLIIAFESETPEQLSTAIEEAYFTLRRLPDFDSLPLDLRIVGGRFRVDFGRLNKLHTHDLPHITRPRSLQNVLGEEGFAREGFNATIDLPIPRQHRWTLSTTLVNGGGLPVAEDNAAEDLAFVGRSLLSLGIAHEQLLEFGASYYVGRRDAGGSDGTQLIGGDVVYFAQTHGHEDPRQIVVGLECFYADVESGSSRSTPFGYYAWVQWQFSQRMILGARYDAFQALDNERSDTRVPGVFLSWQTSPSLVFRCGYERTWSDDPSLDHLDTLLFEINFDFGAPPQCKSVGTEHVPGHRH